MAGPPAESRRSRSTHECARVTARETYREHEGGNPQGGCIHRRPAENQFRRGDPKANQQCPLPGVTRMERAEDKGCQKEEAHFDAGIVRVELETAEEGAGGDGEQVSGDDSHRVSLQHLLHFVKYF